MFNETYDILSSPAKDVDSLSDVAVRAADEHVVFFDVGGGDEGQEGGEEEETHCVRVVVCFAGLVVWCGVVLCCFVVELCVTIEVMLDRVSKGGGWP